MAARTSEVVESESKSGVPLWEEKVLRHVIDVFSSHWKSPVFPAPNGFSGLQFLFIDVVEVHYCPTEDGDAIFVESIWRNLAARIVWGGTDMRSLNGNGVKLRKGDEKYVEGCCSLDCSVDEIRRL